MRDNLSPEEKLLRLIKGQNKKPLPVKPDVEPALSPSQAKPSAHAQTIHLPKLPKSFTLKLNLKQTIILIFSASCLYLLISFIYPLIALRTIKLPQIISKETSEGERPDIKTDSDTNLQAYINEIKNKKMFSTAPAVSKSSSVAGPNVDLIKDISLVGIISGDNPQAIIEDKKSQKSFYLNKGQFFGDFQLEDISEGKVILNYKGERYELHL
ncbi:MAG: hypothetical protein KJ880_02265 [Candidatus Omnitrophica bacterium]|nr:hypothetical protein [Candidatus Omnitrophota bacterium]MBU1870254.1 hypothetical protein [Candidatus Omnitrophota bacterium]